MKRRHLDVIHSDSTGTAPGEPRIDRRQALQIVAVGMTLTQAACSTSPTGFGDAGAGGASEGGASDCADQPAGTDVGDVSNFVSGTWSPAGTARDPFIVAQDDNGVFAFTAICTHQGCTIGAPDASGKSTCPCHGAQYDGNGAVLKGPARSPLVHYAVAICGGHVFVDSATTVDASTRTSVS